MQILERRIWWVSEEPDLNILGVPTSQLLVINNNFVWLWKIFLHVLTLHHSASRFSSNHMIFLERKNRFWTDLAAIVWTLSWNLRPLRLSKLFCGLVVVCSMLIRRGIWRHARSFDKRARLEIRRQFPASATIYTISRFRSSTALFDRLIWIESTCDLKRRKHARHEA